MMSISFKKAFLIVQPNFTVVMVWSKMSLRGYDSFGINKVFLRHLMKTEIVSPFFVREVPNTQ